MEVGLADSNKVNIYVYLNINRNYSKPNSNIVSVFIGIILDLDRDLIDSGFVLFQN